MSHWKKQASYQDKRNVLNKAHLVEPILRHRVQDSVFYKQHLYLTNEETILYVIVKQVSYIGGLRFGGSPSPFLCCLVRLLELEPKREMIELYMDQLGTKSFKYLTALILAYIRFVYSSEQVYETLEGYYSDYRKLRVEYKYPQVVDGKPTRYCLSYMDVFVDELLSKERAMDLILPRLVPRHVLENQGVLQPRVYHIGEFPDGEISSKLPEEASDDYESDSD